ncbi:telomere-protecting terminal protein Tpg [Wenjunlia tyrosinilytica]|uniref:XRE family transcriptional regulator n=1 Tax=Wenjunlia tyrosinilytica TaxID=1544741 RepID=A0A917ZSS0_9ACTN|nr:XRE family transcriptional regulator [Wenjunlia tyrosinilytica]GGO90099.1 hypothetical protein GCM10012280_34840 [Wenjunlia tyrosinilytica]
MGKIDEGLERAAQHVVTRQPPKSTAARVRFLVQQYDGSTRAVARLLGVSQRSVERYLTGERKRPPRPIAERIEAEVRRRWQPRVRKRAEKRAAETGITVEARAQFGFASAVGSTDDPRLRLVTQRLPGEYAARLFEARSTGAAERDLEGIVAEGLQEVYFKDGGRRADGLVVEFTGIDYVEFDFG